MNDLLSIATNTRFGFGPWTPLQGVRDASFSRGAPLPALANNRRKNERGKTVKLDTTISSVLSLCLAAAPLSAQSLGLSEIQGVLSPAGETLSGQVQSSDPGGRKFTLKIDQRIVRAVAGELIDRGTRILIDVAPSIFGGQSYGQGEPGTLGVPGLSHFGLVAPALDISLFAENSAGTSTFGYLYVGNSSASIEMDFGGTLLVNPTIEKMRVPMAVGTTTIPFTIPSDSLLTGRSLYMQMLVFDAGALGGVAMSKGLQLYL